MGPITQFHRVALQAKWANICNYPSVVVPGPKEVLKKQQLENECCDFSGSPEAKTACFLCRGLGFNP